MRWYSTAMRRLTNVERVEDRRSIQMDVVNGVIPWTECRELLRLECKGETYRLIDIR